MRQTCRKKKDKGHAHDGNLSISSSKLVHEILLLQSISQWHPGVVLVLEQTNMGWLNVVRVVNFNREALLRFCQTGCVTERRREVWFCL